MPKANIEWTDERVKKLIFHWNSQTRTAEEIAAMPLFEGATRNSVIGKINRLRRSGIRLLRHSELAEAVGRGNWPNPPKKRRKPKKPRRAAPKPVVAKKPKRVQQKEPPPAKPMSLELTFDELQPRSCRFMAGRPTAGGTYCGHRTVGGGPWCEYHRSLVTHPSAGGHGSN